MVWPETKKGGIVGLTLAHAVTTGVSKSQLLGFESQGQRYACDLLWVKEVLRSPDQKLLIFF